MSSTYSRAATTKLVTVHAETKYMPKPLSLYAMTMVVLMADHAAGEAPLAATLHQAHVWLIFGASITPGSVAKARVFKENLIVCIQSK